MVNQASRRRYLPRWQVTVNGLRRPNALFIAPRRAESRVGPETSTAWVSCPPNAHGQTTARRRYATARLTGAYQNQSDQNKVNNNNRTAETVRPPTQRLNGPE